MRTEESRVAIIGMLFLCTFLSGFGLSHLPKPYNVLLVTVHKLLALCAIVFMGVLAAKAHRIGGLSRLEWTGWLTAGFALLASFITGALLTAVRPPPAVLMAHRIAPYFAATLTAASMYISYVKAR